MNHLRHLCFAFSASKFEIESFPSTSFVSILQFFSTSIEYDIECRSVFSSHRILERKKIYFFSIIKCFVVVFASKFEIELFPISFDFTISLCIDQIYTDLSFFSIWKFWKLEKKKYIFPLYY